MRTATRKPPAFTIQHAAWNIVIEQMETQIRLLPPHLANRAWEIRRWMHLAKQERRNNCDSTAGITVEKDGRSEYVSVWVSATGRARPIVSIALPISVAWRKAHEAYMETFMPDSHVIERDKIIEEDSWLS